MVYIHQDQPENTLTFVDVIGGRFLEGICSLTFRHIVWQLDDL